MFVSNGCFLFVMTFDVNHVFKRLIITYGEGGKGGRGEGGKGGRGRAPKWKDGKSQSFASLSTSATHIPPRTVFALGNVKKTG